MDKDKLEELRIEAEANQRAKNMFLEAMEAIMPDDFQPFIQLPKLCDRIGEKKRAILRLVSAAGIEDGVKLASEANVLLSRVDEALEAFIDQHIDEEECE